MPQYLFSFEPPSRLEAVAQHTDKDKAIAIIDQDHVLIRSWLLPTADGVYGMARPLSAGPVDYRF